MQKTADTTLQQQNNSGKVSFHLSTQISRNGRVLPAKPPLSSCRYCHEKDMSKARLDKHLHEAHSFPKCENCNSVYTTLSIVSGCFQMSHFCNLKYKFECRIKDCKLQNKSLEELDNMISHLYNVHNITNMDELVENLLNQRRIDSNDLELILNIKSNPGEFKFMQYCADKASELQVLKKYAESVPDDYYEISEERSKKDLHDNYNTLVLADKASYRQFVPGNMNPFDFEISPSPQYIENQVWCFLARVSQNEQSTIANLSRTTDKSNSRSNAYHPFAAGLSDSTLPTKMSKLCASCCHCVSKALKEHLNASEIELCFRCQTELGMNNPEEANKHEKSDQKTDQSNNKLSIVASLESEANNGPGAIDNESQAKKSIRPKGSQNVGIGLENQEESETHTSTIRKIISGDKMLPKLSGSKLNTSKSSFRLVNNPSGRVNQNIQTPEQKLQNSIDMCRSNAVTVVRHHMPNPVVFTSDYEAHCPPIFMHIPMDHHRRKKKERSLLSKRLGTGAKLEFETQTEMEPATKEDYLEAKREKSRPQESGTKMQMLRTPQNSSPGKKGRGGDEVSPLASTQASQLTAVKRGKESGVALKLDEESGTIRKDKEEGDIKERAGRLVGGLKKHISNGGKDERGSPKRQTEMLGAKCEGWSGRIGWWVRANQSTAAEQEFSSGPIQAKTVHSPRGRHAHARQPPTKEDAANMRERDLSDKRNKPKNKELSSVIEVD